MGYKERIERAITELFNEQKKIDALLATIPSELEEGILAFIPDIADIAIRLYGMPEDNWEGVVTQEDYDEAVKERVLFCWDGLYDGWRDLKTAEEFIELCNEYRLYYLEEKEKFDAIKESR